MLAGLTGDLKERLKRELELAKELAKGRAVSRPYRPYKRAIFILRDELEKLGVK